LWRILWFRSFRMNDNPAFGDSLHGLNLPALKKEMNAGEFLKEKMNDPTSLDEQILLAHVLRRPRTWLLAHLDTPLSPSQLAEANEAFDQFQAAVPLPYIIGHWEFFGLDLDVTKDVLIPRPETELLVEKAIVFLQSLPDKKFAADIGTGSGAIAVSLAAHVSDVHVLATDVSPAALEVARRNAVKINVANRLDFIECDLLPDRVPAKMNLICANLPYVPTDIMLGLPVYGREPTIALDGGEDGLVLYRRLFKMIPEWLSTHGKCLFEIEASLGPQSLKLAEDSFPKAGVQLHQDLTGRDRLLEITLP
jgi:release factor glutamine methyltransferase